MICERDGGLSFGGLVEVLLLCVRILLRRGEGKKKYNSFTIGRACDVYLKGRDVYPKSGDARLQHSYGEYNKSNERSPLSYLDYYAASCMMIMSN